MRYLVPAAFWAEGDPKEIVDAAAENPSTVATPSTGGYVAIAERDVDRSLRAMLRSVNLQEAADA